MVDGVSAHVDLVPDDWTSGFTSDIVDVERFPCGKGARGVVKAAACAVTRCAR